MPEILIQNPNNMKKILLLAGALLSLAACSEMSDDARTEPVEVTIGFSGFSYEQQGMDTRAATAVGDYATKLDIWISDGETVTPYQQEAGQEGFGTLSLTLNRLKEYTLYAVAHRVTSGHATLSNGVIAFPDDKVTHSFFVSRVFTPTKGMQLDLTMSRIVSQFSFNTTDAVPDWCKTIRFTIYNVYDRWDVAGYGTHQLDRVSTFTGFTTHDGGTVTFNIYAIVTDASTNHDILVEAFEEGATEPREYHLFEDVPLRNNYRTMATGQFFTDAASSFSFKAEDWADVVDYDF